MLGLLLLLGIADLSRPVSRQWTTRILLRSLEVYQSAVSNRLAAAGVRCRFEPSCSRYAAETIRRHGALVGSWKTCRRLARCGPWTPVGTVDPP